jgi:hypothetical protein
MAQRPRLPAVTGLAISPGDLVFIYIHAKGGKGGGLCVPCAGRYSLGLILKKISSPGQSGWYMYWYWKPLGGVGENQEREVRGRETGNGQGDST